MRVVVLLVGTRLRVVCVGARCGTVLTLVLVYVLCAVTSFIALLVGLVVKAVTELLGTDGDDGQTMDGPSHTRATIDPACTLCLRRSSPRRLHAGHTAVAIAATTASEIACHQSYLQM